MSYKSVQAESFAKHNTEAKQWEVCEIKGFQDGRPIYNILYKVVPAWSLNNKISEYFVGANCELCGHPIMNLHYIECKDNEICMLVGSDCVNTFKGAKFTEKHEKIYREKRIRKMFDEWFPQAWKEFKEIYCRKNYPNWNDGVRYDSRKTWNYYKEIRDINRSLNGYTGITLTKNPKHMSIRKLLGIMMRGAILGLTLPEEHKELTEKPPKKEKSK